MEDHAHSQVLLKKQKNDIKKTMSGNEKLVILIIESLSTRSKT